MTIMGAGPAAWAGFVDRAVALDDPDRTPHLLAQTCLTEERVLGRTRWPSDELPEGFPGKQVSRRAARALGEWAQRDPERPEADVWQVVHLVMRWYSPKQEDGRDGDTRLRRHQDHVLAAELAKNMDPALHQWVTRHRIDSARAVQSHPELLQRTLDATRALLDQELPADLESAGPAAAWVLATGDAAWLPPASWAHPTIRYRLWLGFANLARMMRRWDESRPAVVFSIELARRIPSTDMVLYAGAVNTYSMHARDAGEISVTLACERELAELLAEHPETGNSYFSCAASNAEFISNPVRARELHLSRMRFIVAKTPLPIDELTPEAVWPAVEYAHQLGSTTLLNRIGNTAYELSRNLLDSGRAGSDPAVRSECRAWLDVSAATWQNHGVNGLIAIERSRLRLDLLDGTAGDPFSVGRHFLDLSRRHQRVAGQRRNILDAVEAGVPGDPEILARIDEMSLAASGLERAYLKVGNARWHLRRGDRQRHDGQPEGAAQSWTVALRLGQEAAAGLELKPAGDREPLIAGTRSYLTALSAAAQAARRLREARMPGAPSEADELALLVQSLPGLAQRVATATSQQQAQVELQHHRPIIERLVELALIQQDDAALDALLEVVRRDRIGQLLAALPAMPQIHERLGSLAQELLGAISTSMEADTEAVLEAAAPDSLAEPGVPSADPDAPTTRRARNVLRDRSALLSRAAEEIGALAAALVDPAQVLKTRARDLLQPQSGPQAVLQLWHDRVGGRILRRLTARHGDQIEEFQDVVLAPVWITKLSADLDNPNPYRYRVGLLDPTLIPPPLLRTLEAASESEPIRLAIVPTGLFHIPFDALRIGDDALLIDRAIVSVHASLTGAVTTSDPHPADQLETGGKRIAPISVYDTVALKGAEPELANLELHLGPTTPIRDLQSLDAVLGRREVRSAPGLFALALHGFRGEHGWGQVKVMPNGEEFSTAHAMQWNFPRLVVSASCNTDIRQDEDEIGGFPLVFRIRGAHAVIGTLDDINDESTGQIISLFWEHIAKGLPAAEALRVAKLSWLAEGERRPSQIERWAWLIAYGDDGPGPRRTSEHLLSNENGVSHAEH